MENKCCAADSAAPTNEVLPSNSGNIRLVRKPKQDRATRSSAAQRTEPRSINFGGADPSKWSYDEVSYGGYYSFQTQPELEKVEGPIGEGLQKLKESPDRYEGMFWAHEDDSASQSYTLVRRTGSGFAPKLGSGTHTFVGAKYAALPREVQLDCDSYTDSFTYKGNHLVVPLCPGRGHGIADVPTITLIKDVDPNDISQGGVGDCWLLSAISALAEYDGAIARLFRNTHKFENMPLDTANKYIVALWDIPSWTEVDIEVDERLCTRPGSNELLGCTPSIDGELWVCYLEKAIAAHCGGWDKICGGNANHAWRLLLGVKEQYRFQPDEQGRWVAYRHKWDELGNSPHDGNDKIYQCPWPKVGDVGGEPWGTKISRDDMFKRMCLWDDQDYLLSCGSRRGSDKDIHDGIVDGHAYTILECLEDVASSGINMVKVRNPWGKREITSGKSKWGDDGKGWDEHTHIKELLQPVKADDGVFWLDQEEFFKHFAGVYLSAESMSKFTRDNGRTSPRIMS